MCETETTSTTNSESIIALIGIGVTVIISVVSAVYTVASNTKKYELTQSYRKEIMKWYNEVVSNMISIIHCCKSLGSESGAYKQPAYELLSELSSLIEIGRFYFPNNIANDDKGKEKPAAYQGHRDIGLSLLVAFYDIASGTISGESIAMLCALEKNFTSYIFDIIQPRKRNMEFSRYLSISAPTKSTKQEYIDSHPECEEIFEFSSKKAENNILNQHK